MTKKVSLMAAGAVVGAVAFGQCALAEEAPKKDPTDVIPGTVSATLTAASNYLFRGISQTDNIPAVQGSFDYSADLFEGL
ncbi:MAG TPA: TorF family putative porin, partial [Alphaproteobacteria bacterium]|nr:TorF family putative porin [Alphaproteobacteria bacterium]